MYFIYIFFPELIKHKPMHLPCIKPTSFLDKHNKARDPKTWSKHLTSLAGTYTSRYQVWPINLFPATFWPFVPNSHTQLYWCSWNPRNPLSCSRQERVNFIKGSKFSILHLTSVRVYIPITGKPVRKHTKQYYQKLYK